MIDLYYALKSEIKKITGEAFSVSFNDYDESKARSLCVILRDGISSHRNLSTGSYINKCERFEIVAVAGNTKKDIVETVRVLENIREVFSCLNNKHIETDGFSVDLIKTTCGNLNYIGKEKQNENARYTLNGVCEYSSTN